MGNTHTSLYRYAGRIKRNWDNIDKKAKPYVDAMFSLDQITGKYQGVSARTIIVQFLESSRKWKGEIAQETKMELRRIAKA